MNIKKQLLITLGIPFVIWFMLLTALTFYGINSYFSIRNITSSLSTPNDVSIINPKNIIDNSSTIKVVGSISDNLQTATNEFWIFYLILTVLFIIVAVFFVFKAINKISDPLKQLEGKLATIDVNNFSFQDEISLSNAPLELQSLESSFKDLITRLKKSFDKQGRFVNNAAHELKTPLAIVKTSLQLLEMEEKKSVVDYEETFNIIKKSSNTMVALIESLLLLAMEEQGLEKKTIYILPIIQESINDLKLKFPLCEVEVKINKGTSIKAESDMFKNIIDNILTNSAKYGSSNIRISCKIGLNIEIKIQDNGIGIPAEKLPYVTEAFYRCDESRSKEIEGYGLGLSIVNEMINQHSGKFIIESEEGVGTAVILGFSL